MSIDPVGPIASKYFVRIVVLVTCVAAFSWSALILFQPTNSSQLNRIANLVLAGDSLLGSMPSIADLDVIERQAPCHGNDIRAATIIRTRIYEDAVRASDVKLADRRMQELQHSLAHSLTCIPTEGFLWFVRYSAAIRQGASVADHLPDIRMSYRLAPNEGWIAIKRNVFVLAIHDALPADLQSAARKEFVSIVSSGLLTDAARILKGVPPRLRQDLLQDISSAKFSLRQNLDRILISEGFDVAVPGIERRSIPGRL